MIYRDLASALLASAIFCFILIFMVGCETLRLGISTDYGTFSYELPRPESSK
jgi:hypothetical protein